MAASKEKPAYMEYLELKGIRAGGCFCFCDEPGRLYRVTRRCQLLDLAGEPVALTENDFWERLDGLRCVSAEEFRAAQERYRDQLRVQKGQLTQTALEPVAATFAREYMRYYAAGRWKNAGRYDEETMRRILHRAVSLIFSEQPAPQKARRELFDQMFHDLVQAKNAFLQHKEKGQPPQQP